MILRNSLKNIVRSRGKTVLFFLLIFAITMVAVLGVNLWDSVEKYLDECERSYVTIGLFEYMSPEYPDERVFDPGIRKFLDDFDFALITENENVMAWDRQERALGYIEGFERFDSAVPDKLAGVIVVGNLSPSVWGGFKPHVWETLYSYNDMVGNAVQLDNPDVKTSETEKYFIESGRAYVIHGEFNFGGGGVPRFYLKDFRNALAESLGVLDGLNTAVLDVTFGGGSSGQSSGGVSGGENSKYFLAEDNIFRKFARVHEVVNNSVDVYATDNINAFLPFHQQQLYITEGRVFSAEEYAGGAAGGGGSGGASGGGSGGASGGKKVCIVTQLIADKCGVGIGDVIPLSIAVAEDVPVYESYWPDTGFQYEDDYEIVGIMNNVDGMSHYVVIPKSIDTPLGANQVGYTIGQAVIRNGKADEFESQIRPLLSERVRLTVYDQGYAAVRKPFDDILLVVKIITSVSLLLAVAVLAMFGFLFVYRQRDVAMTMISLGTGKARVYAYFGFGAVFLSFFAAGFGSAAGFAFSDLTVKLITWIATGYLAPYDFYSNSKLTTVKALEFAPVADPMLFAAVAGCMVALALIAAMVFLGTKKSGTGVKGRVRRRKEGRSSKMKGSPFKYSILSIRRGGLRSFVVPVVAVMIVFFLSQLAATSGSYAKKLEEIYASAEIKGHFTDPTGRQSGNLLIEAYLLNELLDTGYIKDLSLLRNFSYKYMGRSVAGGLPVKLEPFKVSANFYTAEREYNEILLGDKLVCTNDLKTTTEFLYSDTVVMEFLEGFDESFLAGPVEVVKVEADDPDGSGDGDAKDVDLGNLPAGSLRENEQDDENESVVHERSVPDCMISTDMMEEFGILLGDTIRVAIATDSMYEYDEMDLKVVGSFEKQGLKDQIYIPLAAYVKPELLYGEPAEVKEKLFSYKFQSAVFGVADASKLEEFRNVLFDAGYSEVRNIGPVRFFIVLEDRIFNNTVNTLKQQIRYINILYPFLYLMVGAIGFIVSYLLIAVRRSEIVIMRGLGAKRGRVFLSFFFEQALLCVVGCAIGLAGWFAAFGSFEILQFWLVGGFVLFFFVGCAFAFRDGGKLSGL